MDSLEIFHWTCQLCFLFSPQCGHSFGSSFYTYLSAVPSPPIRMEKIIQQVKAPHTVWFWTGERLLSEINPASRGGVYKSEVKCQYGISALSVGAPKGQINHAIRLSDTEFGLKYNPSRWFYFTTPEAKFVLRQPLSRWGGRFEVIKRQEPVP